MSHQILRPGDRYISRGLDVPDVAKSGQHQTRRVKSRPEALRMWHFLSITAAPLKFIFTARANNNRPEPSYTLTQLRSTSAI